MSSESGPNPASPNLNRDDNAEARLKHQQETSEAVEQRYHDLIVEKEKKIDVLDNKVTEQEKTIKELRKQVKDGKDDVRRAEGDREELYAEAERDRHRADQSERAAKDEIEKAKDADQLREESKKELARSEIDKADLVEQLADAKTLNDMLNQQLDTLEDENAAQRAVLQEATEAKTSFQSVNEELDNIFRGIAPGGRTVDGHLEYLREVENNKNRRAASQVSLERHIQPSRDDELQNLRASRGSISDELQESGYRSSEGEGEDEEDDEDPTLTNANAGTTADTGRYEGLMRQLETRERQLLSSQRELENARRENDVLREKANEVQEDVDDLRKAMENTGTGRYFDPKMQREIEELKAAAAVQSIVMNEQNAAHAQQVARLKAETATHEQRVARLTAENAKLKNNISVLGNLDKKKAANKQGTSTTIDFYHLCRAAPLWLQILAIALVTLYLYLLTDVMDERHLWKSANDLTRRHVVKLSMVRNYDSGWFTAFHESMEKYLEIDKTLLG